MSSSYKDRQRQQRVAKERLVKGLRVTLRIKCSRTLLQTMIKTELTKLKENLNDLIFKVMFETINLFDLI